jgi:N4-gp56 family major capsid protein
MSVNTLASNFSADVSTYIAKKLLSLALKQLVMYQICDKPKQPANSGRTFQFTRFERVALPQSPLGEGVTPGDSAMAITTVTAVLDQWGAVIPISDVAIDSVTHPVLQKAIGLAGMQAKEVLDREAVKIALTGTNLYFPGVVASRGGLLASDKMQSTIVGKVVAGLRQNGAMPYDGDMLIGVIDPFVEDDILADTTFVQAAVYAGAKKLYNSEVGSWKGVRWVRSNAIPIVKYFAGSSAKAGAAGGALTASTTYNFKLCVVDKNTGEELFIGPVESQATGVGEGTVNITMPALPTGATAGSLYRIYFGSNGGTLYKYSSDHAAAAVVGVTSLPTSGDVAPASPPAGGSKVHFSFVVGMGALAASELNKVQAYLTPNQPSDSDPLVQRRKVGWKTDFKVFITNESFMARIESGATNG